MRRSPSGALALALAVATLWIARSSRADEDDYTPAAHRVVSEAPRPVPVAVAVPIQVETQRHWYGWQTLSADGAALSFLTLGSALASDGDSDAGRTGIDSFVVVGVGMYALGGPIVHAAHQNWGAAAASLGLRVGLPLAGILIGSGVDGCGAKSDADVCGAVGPALGALLGIGAAIAIDAAALGYEQVPATNAATTPRPLAAITTPLVIADAHQAMLGVMGTF